MLEHAGTDAVVAVTEADYPPYWMLSIDEGRLRWIFPEGGRVDHRQQLPRAYRPNGSIYAINVTALRAERTFYPRETAPFVMAREDSRQHRRHAGSPARGALHARRDELSARSIAVSTRTLLPVSA